MEKKINRAVSVIHKRRESYELMLYVVECASEEDVSLVSVPHLPYIITKDMKSQEWSLYNEVVLIDVVVRAIQTYGRCMLYSCHISSYKPQ